MEPTIYKALAATFLVFGFIFHTLRDKCQHHYDRSWFKDIEFFRPNWQNRYVMDTGRIIKTKWWADIFSFLIDGPHLLGDIMLFWILQAVYIVAPDVWGNWFAYMAIFIFLRMLEHFVIMHGDK